MNVLTVVLVFSVLMGVVAFAAGLALSVRHLRGPGGGADRLAGEIRQELNELRQRRVAIR